MPSLFDVNVFNLSASFDNDINSDRNLHSLVRHDCRYFSPHSFQSQNNSLTDMCKNTLSFLHNNVRSLKRNIEAFQNHLLSELSFSFNVIGVSETRIIKNQPLLFNPDLPGYNFEYTPTPLSAGGVGIYIADNINYSVLEKTSNIYFQALWVELDMGDNHSVICGVVYRQHNDPTKFLNYLSETLYNFNKLSKTVCLMGDFNIDLLKYESCTYSKEFLNDLYSATFFPTISKPTRVHGDSATLIDNIFLNNVTFNSLSGNIVSDISDHFSQVCLLYNNKIETNTCKRKIRDYTNFNKGSFLSDLQTNFEYFQEQTNTDLAFNTFYNKLNKTVNKHAPYKVLSRRKAKQLFKQWITKGIRKSIRLKNKYFRAGNRARYKICRNKVSQLIRHSKILYYQSFFETNLNNMKQTWKGINNLIFNKKRKNKCKITAIKKPNSLNKTKDQHEMSNILNAHFATTGERLARSIPETDELFSSYLKNPVRDSFFFNAVTANEIAEQIAIIYL